MSRRLGAQRRLLLSGTYKPGHLEPGDAKPGDSPLRRLLPRLVERGFDGEDTELSPPGPASLLGASPALPCRPRSG